MKWTEESEPKEGISYYNHSYLDTPIGRYIIEWKSWKDSPSYDVYLKGEWIGTEYSLEEAKNISQEHLIKKFNELKEYLEL